MDHIHDISLIGNKKNFKKGFNFIMGSKHILQAPFLQKYMTYKGPQGTLAEAEASYQQNI